MLFSVGSPHDKSRQQAWCMGPTTSFSRHASHFMKSYVLFRDKSDDLFFFPLGTFFLKRPAYYAAYLPNVYASLRLLTFFQDKEDSALLTLPLLSKRPLLYFESATVNRLLGTKWLVG